MTCAPFMCSHSKACLDTACPGHPRGAAAQLGYLEVRDALPEQHQEIGYEAARLNQLEGGNVINFAGDEPDEITPLARAIVVAAILAVLIVCLAAAVAPLVF